jgi:outer membrane protein TolC
MRHLYLIFFFFAASICCINTNAQNIAQNSLSALTFEEKLVELAYQFNQNSKIFAAKREQAKAQKFMAKTSWTNSLMINYSYFAQFNQMADAAGPTIIPRTGVNIGINIGSIISTPSKVRFAKEEFNIIEAEEQKDKNAIKAEVLRRYKDYLLSLELFKIQSQILEDSRTTNLMIKKRFENGEVPIEQYTESLRLLNEIMEKKTESEFLIQKNKVSVEELIGLPLEQVQ